MWTSVIAAAFYAELQRLDFDPEQLVKESTSQIDPEKEAEKEADKKGVDE